MPGRAWGNGVSEPYGPDIPALLVLEGLLTRDVHHLQKRATELPGPGDLLRPFHEITGSSVPHEATWRIRTGARVVVLDQRLMARLARIPGVMSELLDRTDRRCRSAKLQLAISRVRPMPARLWLLFWHLADRWGQRRNGEVLLSLPLTHGLLAELVARRAPVGLPCRQGTPVAGHGPPMRRRVLGAKWPASDRAAGPASHISVTAVTSGSCGPSPRLQKSFRFYLRSLWDRRVSAWVLVILGGLLVTAIALAHTKATVSFEGAGNGWCMYAQSGINGEKNVVGTSVTSYTEPCDGFKAKDPYHLRTKVATLKKRSDGTYYHCTYGSWGYNTHLTYRTATVEYWGGPTGPCGSGLYRTRGHQGLYSNGDWKRGKNTSPAHYW
jgi:hypothetical protein